MLLATIADEFGFVFFDGAYLLDVSRPARGLMLEFILVRVRDLSIAVIYSDGEVAHEPPPKPSWISSVVICELQGVGEFAKLRVVEGDGNASECAFSAVCALSTLGKFSEVAVRVQVVIDGIRACVTSVLHDEGGSWSGDVEWLGDAEDSEG